MRSFAVIGGLAYGVVKLGIIRSDERYVITTSNSGYALHPTTCQKSLMEDEFEKFMQQDIATLHRKEEDVEANLEENVMDQEERRAEFARQHQEERQAKWREEVALVEKYTVHDEATLITCAAGLEVWHVVTGFDLCKLKIKNLPKSSRESDIADTLATQNAPFSEFLITRHHTTRDTNEAVVLVGKEVGRALALELDGLVFRDQVLQVEISDHSTRRAMISPEQLSPKLTVSWKGQTDTLLASYPSNEEAVKRAKELDGILWKGQKLVASLNQHQRASSSSIKSVKITRYPSDATSDTEFLDLIGTQSYRILKTKPYNHQCTLIMVRIHLRQLHGVRMDTYEELTSPADLNETMVTVQFDDWEDVKRAYASFHRKKLGTGEESTPTLRASYPNPHQLLTTISRRQFQAQEKQWNALKEQKQGKRAYLHITQHEDTTVIYVLGDDFKASGALKVRVEKLASGEALDARYWHSDFANNGRQFFKRVHAETGVHIKVESRMQFLRIFGEPDKVGNACSLIRAEVQRLRCMATDDDKRNTDQEKASDLNLDGDQECEGEGNDRLIRHSFPEDRSDLSTSRNVSCVVCYCEASAPEYLGCGHVYCTECLRHFLSSASDTRNFPITCIGDDATCNTSLPIPVIRRHMDNQAFQHLVEVAFTCHLEQHPEEYRYCITPDCRQIYRFRREEGWQCPSCFLKICGVCGEESHEGLTCAERRLQRDPALLEELKESLGYRKCPQCSAWIEKAGGCNHITCRCGGHICWRCMDHFPVGDIYNHLNKTRCKTYKPLPRTQKIVNRLTVSMQPNGCPEKTSQSDDVEYQGRARRCVIM